MFIMYNTHIRTRHKIASILYVQYYNCAAAVRAGVHNNIGNTGTLLRRIYDYTISYSDVFFHHYIILRCEDINPAIPARRL